MTRATKKFPLLSIIIKQLRAWHRKIGIITAFFLIFLSVTGVAINHAHWLNLDRKPVTNSWLLNFYGIKAPQNIRFFDQGHVFITDHLVWFNKKLLLDSADNVISIAPLKTLWLLATNQQLYLYSEQGELVDQIDNASGLPANIQALGLNNGNVVLKTANGIFQSDSDLIRWQKLNTLKSFLWIKAITATDRQRHQAILQFKAHFLNWEKVLLDMHSGRIFSLFGVLLSDIVALLIIILSLSGLYIWLRYAKNKR